MVGRRLESAKRSMPFSPVCDGCRHFHIDSHMDHGQTCDAFRDRIPGDGGIQFAPMTEADRQERIAWLRARLAEYEAEEAAESRTAD
jgi:hypothetical protein